MPFIDIAYQGFGDGLDADAAGTRLIAAGFPEVLIAASCSKNFGIYRERTGLLIALGTAAQRGTRAGQPRLPEPPELLASRPTMARGWSR